ncbi:MAG: 7-carboxy-7-deazaguanine synthase QueE [Pseudomonadales bacterium]|nr:7-carboxy-7-deazaguanine synthase QueE [Pseudomonadales bacterium]
MSQLRITEIFHSLQGEAATAGLPTAFVRLTSCPLRCHYCDTTYAFSGGQLMGLDDILQKVSSRKVRHVTVTGGEPLAQPDCLGLLKVLCDTGYQVSLETSGAMDTIGVDERVSVVLDLKTPGSGESSRNLYGNVSQLKPIDQVKFVICNREDYEWARFKVEEYALRDKVAELLFSVSHEELESSQLAQWILEDELDVRLQIQLHKYLWGDKPGV